MIPVLENEVLAFANLCPAHLVPLTFPCAYCSVVHCTTCEPRHKTGWCKKHLKSKQHQRNQGTKTIHQYVSQQVERACATS